jgi:hypothetical protein
MLYLEDKITLAYVIGVALGDGNLSQISRSIRLRITCDLKYPILIETIQKSLQIVAPRNNVGIVKNQGNCLDIYCYSNDWPEVLGWNPGGKIEQKVTVPGWIFTNESYMKACLRGLLQTDGCIYIDRGYSMVNFVNSCKELAYDVLYLFKKLGFYPNLSIIDQKNSARKKYTIRLAKDVERFMETIQLRKD